MADEPITADVGGHYTSTTRMWIEGRCGTCRHWATIDLDDPLERKPTLYDDNGRRVRDAEYDDVPAPGRWGWCQRVAEFGPNKASRFYVVDGSEYMAKLGTREDFGCVEHEATSAEP